MDEAFDPYIQWLDIPRAEQPANYYRLLGLKPLEGNLERIARALKLRTDQVQLRDDGTHPEAARRVREHLAGAGKILLDPTMKQQYDALLGPKMATPPEIATPPGMATPPKIATPPGMATPPKIATPPGVASPPRMATPPGMASQGGLVADAQAKPQSAAPEPPPPPAVPVQPTPGPPPALDQSAPPSNQPPAALNQPIPALDQPGETAAAFVAKRRAAARRFWISLILFTATAVLAAVVFLSRRDMGDRQQPEAGPETVAGAGDDPQPGPRRPSDTPAAPPVRQSATSPAQAPVGPMDQADAPPDGTVFELLKAAQLALSGRDMATAGGHIATAAKLAKTPAEREFVGRVQTLYESVDVFWKSVHQAAGQLRNGEQLPTGDTTVMIVDVNDEGLLVRASGENRRYAVRDLPVHIAVALAERRLIRDQLRAHLCVGAFLAVDAQGDRRQAFEDLQKAGPQGQDLIAVLELRSDVGQGSP